MTIFVLRPEPGIAATREAAREMGLSVIAEPLATIAAVEWDEPGDETFDALLLGSANAIRHAGGALTGWRGRDACVVGATTGAAARSAGLNVIAIGSGGLQPLIDNIERPVRLLRLAGERHIELDPPRHVEIATRIVYRVVDQPVSPALARSLEKGGVVLLHSGETARHFAAECDRLHIAQSGLAIAALAPRIAEAAGGGWRLVEVADVPTDGALLELARDMCH